MEDYNEVSDSALNRVENLERIVRKFKLSVSGDGNVSGGFGKLPKNNEELPLPERLANISQARNKFNLVGHQVGVDGSFDDGFNFS